MRSRVAVWSAPSVPPFAIAFTFCCVLLPGVSHAASSDDVGSALASAKVEHKAALDSLSTALVIAMQAAIKETATEGDLQKVKAAMAEKDGWVKQGRLSASPAFSECVKQYLTDRRAASTKLLNAYRDAVAGYTKQLKLDEATAIENEMKAFIATEKAVLAGKAANPVAEAKPENPKIEEADRKYLPETIAKLRTSFAEIATEDTSAKRDKAYKDLLNRVDAEMQRKRATLHFPIQNIRKDGAEYRLSLAAPDELADIADLRYRNSWTLPISDEAATKVNPGDYFAVSGPCRIAKGGFGDLRTRDTEPLFTFRDEYMNHTIYMQKLTHRIEPKQDIAESRPENAKKPESITNSIRMKLNLIPAGEFLMGSPEKQYRVRITRPFYLGTHEVTRSNTCA